MSRNVATSPATRAEALRVATEKGAAQASRETGVPSGTIRAWMSRRPDREIVRPGDDIAQLARTAKHARRVVSKAISRVEELIPLSKNPQAIAVSAGILCDKASQLEQVVATMEDRQTRLAQREAGLIADVLKATMRDVGMDTTSPAVLATIAYYMKQAAKGSTLTGPAPTAHQAREGIYRQLLAENMPRHIETTALPTAEHTAAQPAEQNTTAGEHPAEHFTRQQGSPEPAPFVAVQRDGAPALAGEVVDETPPKRPWRPRFPGDVEDAEDPYPRQSVRLRPLTPRADQSWYGPQDEARR